MKRLLLFFSFFLFVHFTIAQNPLVKQWDYRFGGDLPEYLRTSIKTSDAGFLLGGVSFSWNSGDKTESNWDTSFNTSDFWIIKIDSLGTKQWDKRFGGTHYDICSSMSQTIDGGYILGGWSQSDSSGDISQHSYGSFDFWIVRIDSSGNLLWEKRFGGTDEDVLSSILQTSDGGFIFGGITNSDSSAIISQQTRGSSDMWILKTDSSGNKQWDKRFGGTYGESLYSILQTTDNGYILGGVTSSDSSGDVSQPTRGGEDYWTVKVDSLGIKQWDKRYGGLNSEMLISIQQTIDGGYILGGQTNSDSTGDVTEHSRGSFDYWIVKVDSSGNKQWDKRFGGISEEYFLGYVKQTLDKGYLLGGVSHSDSSGDKSDNNLSFAQAWVVKTDSLGNKKWDRTILTLASPFCIEPIDDYGGFALDINFNCFVVSLSTAADAGGDKTQANWNSPYCGMDYWIIKFCDTSETNSISQLPNQPITFSIYPNPAKESIVISQPLLGNKINELAITDVLGRKMVEQKITSANQSINISILRKGIYFLKIQRDEIFYVKKLVVE